MSSYIIRRLLSAIPTLLILSFIIFGLLRLLPGDIALSRLAEAGAVTDDDLDRMRNELGIDRPFLTQYADWVFHLVQGDLGDSLFSSEPVVDLIRDRLPLTLEIVLLSVSLSVLIAAPLGVVSAVKQDTVVDYAARLLAIAGLSFPDFVLGSVTLLALSLWIGWLPEFRWFPPWEDPWRNFQAMIFPVAIIGFRSAAVTARMTRSTMLEVLREDYVRSARAKGLSERTIVLRHALRNSLIPVITIIGAQISFLFGGTVIIEQIFGLPGMGRLTFQAVLQRDYTVVQGTVLMMGVVFIVVNLATDLAYAVLDPRIRYS